MKILLLLIVCLPILIPKYVYSSDSCQSVLSVLISEGVNMFAEVKKGLKSSAYTDRLKALNIIKNVNPDGLSFYAEVLPLIKDPHPQLRMMVAKVFQQHDSVDANILYALYWQLDREDNPGVAAALHEAVDTIHKRHWEQFTRMGERVRRHIYALYLNIEKVDHLVKKLGFTPLQWMEITQIARNKKPDQHTVTEELAIEIYNEISATENDLKRVIRTLPFTNSFDFFKFIAQYQQVTGIKVKVNAQTYLIIKQMYALL